MHGDFTASRYPLPLQNYLNRLEKDFPVEPQGTAIDIPGVQLETCRPTERIAPIDLGKGLTSP